MKRRPKAFGAALVAPALFLFACNSDPPAVGSSGYGDDTTTGTDDGLDEESGVDEGLDEESGGAEGGGGGTAVPCSFPGMLGSYDSIFNGAGSLQTPLPEVQHTIDVMTVCGGVPELGPELAPMFPQFDVYVYRPWDSVTDWPTEPNYPTVFFSPGGGLNTVNDVVGADLTMADNHYYSHVFEPLTEDGHIVIAVQPPNDGTTSEARRKMLGCAMIWARDHWAEAARVSQSAVLMGHSRGGAAAMTLVETLYDTDDDGTIDDLTPGSAIDDYEICGMVPIAGRWGPDTAIDTPTNVDIDETEAPPMLALLGGQDDDTRGQQISMLDARVGEEPLTQGGELDPGRDVYPETLVQAYGVGHTAWGGVPGTPTGKEIADIVGPHYIREFLRWQVLGDISGRQAFVDLTDPSLTAMELPAGLAAIADWTNVCALCPFYDGCNSGAVTCDVPPAVPSDLVGLGRPVLYGTFTEGAFSQGASRFVVDTLTRPMPGSGEVIGDSTLGGSVEIVSPGSGTAEWGWAQNLTASLGETDWNYHLSSALRLDWGSNGDLYVRWNLTDAMGLPLPNLADLTDYTHLSLRIGNIMEGDDACHQFDFEHPFDEVEGDIRLHYESGGMEESTEWQSIGLLVDSQSVPSGTECLVQQFMHTVRLPLATFCEGGGVSIGNLRGIELRLQDKDMPQRVQVDSIEFTRDPAAVGTSTCGLMAMAWDCVAAPSLVPRETSCGVVPDPTCPPTSVVQTTVPVPWVQDLAGGFNGWVVHTPAGWVSDPSAPRPEELDAVVQACVAACELEWSDDLDVDAACAASMFSAVAPRASAGTPALARIPDNQEHGGFFGGQSLACNLESDCCEEFDEDLCKARPTRHTEATQPLGIGEEYRVEFDTSSTVTFTTPGGAVAATMSGEAGFSHCKDGASGTACPFYLGSASATATSSAAIVDTCPDGSYFEATIEDLDVELLQPAFGQADQDSYGKVMPAGSLLMRGLITVDGATFEVNELNQDPVYITATEGWMFAMNMGVQVVAPCGDSTIPVSITFDLTKGDTLDSPPEVVINTPTSVSCPSVLLLDATATDPDTDLDSVRWYVDDMLLAESTSTIQINQPRMLRAVARDARGAATTATQLVTCH